MLNAHAAAVLVLTVLALYRFSRERLPIETSSLLILTLLAIGFSVFPFKGRDGALDPLSFFSGFGNEALIAICALMMCSEGLVRTNALAPVGQLIGRAWSHQPQLAWLLVLLFTATVSAFMNNTPQVALMIPLLSSGALRSGASPSKPLRPMPFP